MLKITIDNTMNAATLKLEGRLAGPWVGELERSWRALKDDSRDKPVTVDLCEVTFVDAEGRKLLGWMYEQGARLRTFGCLAKGIVEEIVQEHSQAG
jgi:anti-anti-sigma regulatory factor